MTETEMAEARKLVRFGIAQGWISEPVRGNTVDWAERPQARSEGSSSGNTTGAGNSIENPGEGDQPS